MALHEFNGKKPKIGKSCFVAPSAEIIGDVEIADGTSVWFNTTIRGDMNSIKIGRNVSIQDGSVLHISMEVPLEIGDDVVVGHNAIVHSAQIGTNCIIGMGVILLTGSVIGKNCIIGAGSVVTEGTIIPEGSVVMGIPAKVIKPATEEHINRIKKNVQEYMELNREYLKPSRTK